MICIIEKYYMAKWPLVQRYGLHYKKFDLRDFHCPSMKHFGCSDDKENRIWMWMWVCILKSLSVWWRHAQVDFHCSLCMHSPDCTCAYCIRQNNICIISKKYPIIFEKSSFFPIFRWWEGKASSLSNSKYMVVEETFSNG